MESVSQSFRCGWPLKREGRGRFLRTFEEDRGRGEHDKDDESVRDVRETNTEVRERQPRREAEDEPASPDPARADPHRQRAPLEEPLVDERLGGHKVLDQTQGSI